MDPLSTSEYLRERLAPRPGDPVFLHLSDLRQALEPFQTDRPLKILDYGCGGSPYRSLFPNARYERADYADTTGIDYVLDADGTLSSLPDGSYDMVISTQVLEHVSDPQAYLTEARRLLRRGGTLLLSTHGTFQDHGCPDDYWRWTADGLRLAIERSGFTVKSISRLTCGLRAVAFLWGQIFRHSPQSRGTLRSFILRVICRVGRSFLPFFESATHALTADEAVQSPPASGPIPLCIGLLACAEKP